MRAIGSVRSTGYLKYIVVAATVPMAASASIQVRSPRNASQGTARSTDPLRLARMLESAPLGFEPNHGQFEGPERFVTHGHGYTLKLSPTDATMDLGRPEGAAEPVQVRMKVVGGNPGAEMRGEAEQPGKSHYFRGNDPARWVRNVPSYARVAAAAIYPGIDLVYHGDADRLEWDFVVAPGTDPARIRLRFEGAQPLRLDGNGDLVVETTAGVVRQKKPVLYQEVGSERRTVGGAYDLIGPDEVGFQVAAYDATRPLVIDPELVYSTYVAGCSGRQGLEDVAVDSDGNTYTVGYQPVGCDREPSHAWVVKFSPDGTRLVSTKFGGWGGTIDVATGVALDAANNVYVTGWTNWAQPGGPPPFPTTPDAFQPMNAGVRDAFVTRLDPALSNILYSTFLGGSGDDVGTGITVGETGIVYVAGRTASTDFPTANAVQPYPGGGQDAFITALDLAASSLVYSTYLGGSGDDLAARLARTGSAIVLTGTTSSPDLPVRSGDEAGPFQASFGGGASDAFVARYSCSGTLDYLTYLGGSDRDEAYGIAADASGFAYVTGGTASPDYPTLNPLQPSLSFPPEGDVFVTKLDPSGSRLAYSTYLEVGGDVAACAQAPGQGPPFGHQCGGIAVGRNGEAYVTAKGVFVAKLCASGASRVYTFNGYGGDAIDLDAAGKIVVSGKGAFGSSQFLFPIANASDPYANTYESEAGRLTRMTDGPNPGAQIEQDDSRIVYAGTWETDSSPEHSGGTATRSMEAGAKAAITFNGSGIQLIGERGPSAGIVRVSLDNDPFKQNLSLDTYASPAEARSLLLSFSVVGAGPGPHTLRLEITGTQSSRSAGAWVSVDGFNVLGAPEPSPSPSPTPTPEPTPTPTPEPTPTPTPEPTPTPTPPPTAKPLLPSPLPRLPPLPLPRPTPTPLRLR